MPFWAHFHTAAAFLLQLIEAPEAGPDERTAAESPLGAVKLSLTGAVCACEGTVV